MEGFTITKMLDLPAQKVWAIASDFTKFPGPAISVQVEEKGSPELNGVGTVRTIIIGRVQVRERLESVNPPKPFTYRILSGAPMKDYLATVKISSRGNSTEIRWDAQFTPKFPGTGWIVGKVTKNTINRFIDEIEAGAR